MDSVEKVYFIHSTYDFDSGNALSYDETTLLLRSVVKGLAKACPEQAQRLMNMANMEAALDANVDTYVKNIFGRLGKDKRTVSSSDLQAYCASHPVISSWLTFCATFPYSADKVAIQMAAARGTVAEKPKEQVYPTLPLNMELCAENTVENTPRASVFGDRAAIELYVPPQEEEAIAKGAEEKKGENAEEEEEETSAVVVPEEEINYAAPWQKMAAGMEMEQETTPVYRNDVPEDAFDKNWIHGYSGADGVMRTAAYAGSSIVYTSGQYAISLAQVPNPEDEAAPPTWSQRALEEHYYPIRAMDVSIDRKLFATSDVVQNLQPNQEARVVVWDAATLSPISSSYAGKGEGQGMRALDFSRDGTLLLALSADVANTVTIFKVATMEIVHSQCLGEESEVRDVRFLGTNTLYAAAGAKGMTFYVDEGTSLASGGYRSYEPRKGLLQGAPVDGKQATAICKFDLLDECISGTSTGHLLFWRGRSCIQSIQAHDNAISCLSYCPETRTVVSASLDGSVRSFKVLAGADSAATTSKSGPKLLKVRQLEQTSAFDIFHLDCPSRQIVALSINNDSTKAVIGTASGDFFEVSLRATLPDGAVEPAAEEGEEPAAPAADAPQKRFGNDLHAGALASSHWAAGKAGKRKITGLVATEGGFLSSGSDGSVRKWACAEGARNKVVNTLTCDSGISTMAASAVQVAVALDETGLESRLGLVQLYNLADLKYVVALEECKGKNVQMMRFSADGNTLLVVTATEGAGSILIYKQADAAWTKAFEIKMETTVVALDFHAEGTFIRVCDHTDFLHIYSTVKTEEMSIGDEFFEADVKKLLYGAAWASATCPTSWDTQGLFVGLDFSHTVPKPKLPPVVVQDEDSAQLQPGEVAEEKVEEEVVEEPPVLPELVAKLGLTAKAQHLLLSTGRSGIITVTRYPAVQDFQDKDAVIGRKSFKAHLGDIAALVFLGEAQDRLVTIGKEDGMIIVWKVTYDLDEFEAEPEGGNPDGEEEAVEVADGFGYDSAEDEDLFDGERMSVHLTRETKRPDDEAVAVKDWCISVDRGLNDVVGPTALSTETPNDELDLEWVYGYSARQTRASVQYDNDGRIVYPASTFGVVLEKATDAEHEGEIKQHLAHAHHDEVSALDVHTATGRAATGHKGHGFIFVAVWDTATRQVLNRVNVGAVNGVSAIAFTPDGNCLLVACQDAEHTVKVVDWRSGHIRAAGNGGTKKVLGFAISQAVTPGKVRFLQVGVGNFRFHEYTEGTSVLSTKSGKYGAGVKKETVLCCASLPMGPEGGAEFVVGMANGNMGIIGRGERVFSSTQNVIVGGPCTAVACVPSIKTAAPDEPPKYSIIFGGAGNRIRMYSSELEIALDVDLCKPWGPMKDKEYKLSPLGRVRGIKSICVDKQVRKILYGTSAGEIGEIDIESAADMNDGPLVNAHFRDRLKSLMPHPIRQECLTAGEDKTLRVWNLKTHKMMTQITLPDVCCAAAYAPNGQIIVAGLGGEVRGDNRQSPRDFDGKVAIVSYLQGVLQIVHIAGDATDAITCICFSPSGNLLYVGSNDCNIYVYDPLDNFKLKNTLKVHGEGVISMDMSFSGDYLLSCGADGEIVTWDLTLNTPTSFSEDQWKTTKFYSRESVRGHNSTGVYYPFQSANSVISCGESFDGKLLATGDAFGAVRLFSNPAIQLGAPSKAFQGHSPGGVSRVSFTQDDEFLLSAGQDDRCIMQWRVKKSSIKPFAFPVEEVDSRKVAVPAEAAKAEVPLGNFAETFLLGNVDLSAKLPVALEEAEEITEKSLNLVNTLGMCGEKSTATYSGLGSVVTVTGRVITTLHPNRQKQNHRQYLARTDSVGAVATSSCYRFLAVGASTDGGSLCVINAATGAYVSVLADSIKGGVAAIAFSHDNTFCAAIAGDERHTVYLYSTMNAWKDTVLHWTGETSKADVKFIAFLSGSDKYNFVTGDDRELKWWTITGRNVTSESCQLEGSDLTTLVGLPNMGVLASGHKNGSLFHWSGPATFAEVGGAGEVDSGPSLESKSGVEKKLSMNASDEDVPVVPPVTALNVSSSGLLISGSSAGIVLWQYRKDAASSEFSIASNASIPLTEVTAGASNKAFMDLEKGTYPNSMCSDAAGQRLLVSLNTNSIYEVAIDSRNSFVVAEGELQVSTTSFCAHPTEAHTFITGISTGLVKVWNLSANTREVTGVLSLEKKPPTAISFINDTTMAVAVDRSDTGGKSGAVFLVELKPADAVAVTGGRQLAGSSSRELKIVKKIHNIGKAAVMGIKLSPDGKTLACCSGDGSVYFFDTTKDYAPAGSAICHQNVPVMSCDWSTDSAYLRAFGPTTINDQVMKLSFFSYEFGAEEPVTGLKDDVELDPINRTVLWASASSPAAFEAAGCHPASMPGVGALKGEMSEATGLPTVTSITVDARRIVKYLAAGYTDGSIKLFKFPCVANQSSTVSQTQSSNPVKVCFLAGGALVSISDADGSLAVYE